jgi:hypothetical protein
LRATKRNAAPTVNRSSHTDRPLTRAASSQHAASGNIFQWRPHCAADGFATAEKTQSLALLIGSRGQPLRHPRDMARTPHDVRHRKTVVQPMHFSATALASVTLVAPKKTTGRTMDLASPLIQAALGGAGGLVGGNILGRIGKGGFGTNTLTGIIGGAVATYFFGPTYGPMIGGLVGGGDIGSILGALGVGAGGGGVLGLVVSVLRGLTSR